MLPVPEQETCWHCSTVQQELRQVKSVEALEVFAMMIMADKHAPPHIALLTHAVIAREPNLSCSKGFIVLFSIHSSLQAHDKSCRQIYCNTVIVSPCTCSRSLIVLENQSVSCSRSGSMQC